MIVNPILANSYLALLAALLVATVRSLANIGQLFHLVNLSMALLLITLVCDNLVS
jgi:hypothetical protein